MLWQTSCWKEVRMRDAYKTYLIAGDGDESSTILYLYLEDGFPCVSVVRGRGFQIITSSIAKHLTAMASEVCEPVKWWAEADVEERRKLAETIQGTAAVLAQLKIAWQSARETDDPVLQNAADAILKKANDIWNQLDMTVKNTADKYGGEK